MNRDTSPREDLGGLSELVDAICQKVLAGEEVDLDQWSGKLCKQRDRLAEMIRVLKELKTLNGLSDCCGMVAGVAEGNAPRLLGDFRLIRQLGRGGMGVVYEAQQMSIDRRVALKVLPVAALIDERALQRFRVEVAAIANLEHPHIVSVYSAGEDRGIHYFSMQLIRGQSMAAVIQALKDRSRAQSTISGDEITQVVVQLVAADQRGMPVGGDAHAEADDPTRTLARDPPPKRVTQSSSGFGDASYFRNAAQLVWQAADGLSYAHRRGIIHRDIKPANLLLDTQGSLYVADFGLARMESEAGITGSGDIMGTLRYMSPEQIQGHALLVDHRTDQYSLGATLYEWLTLQPMVDGADRAGFAHQITSVEPKRLRNWNPSIPWDLETIVLKAVQKDPGDRYPTMDALAADLQRFLQMRPIEASRPTVWRRFELWVRRNPAMTWSAMATMFALLVASIITIMIVMNERDHARGQSQIAQQANERSQRRLQQAIDSVKRFRDAVANNEALKFDPALQELRMALLKEPLAFFQTLRNELQADQDARPDAMVRFAQAGYDLGVLLGEIGDKSDSMGSYRESAAVLEHLLLVDPNNQLAQAALSLVYQNMGCLFDEQGKPAEALELLRKSIAGFERIRQADPDNVEFLMELGNCYNNMGVVLKQTGQLDEALQSLIASLRIRQELVEAHPDEGTYRSELARAHFNLGLLARQVGRFADAASSFETALGIQRALVDTDPINTQWRRYLAATLNEKATLLSDTDQAAESIETHRAALDFQKQLVEEFPTVSIFQNDLAFSYNHIGILKSDAQELDEALAFYEQAREIRQALVDANPTILSFQRNLGLSHNNIGNLLQRMGRSEDALASLEAALTILKKLVAINDGHVELQSELAGVHLNIANLASGLGKPADALTSYEAALAVLQQLATDHPTRPEFASMFGVALHNLALFELDDSRINESYRHLRMAREWQAKALAANPAQATFRQRLAVHLHGLIDVAHKLSLDDEAAAAARELERLTITNQPKNQ